MEDQGQEPAERSDAFDDLFEDLDRFFAPDPEQARRRAAGSVEGEEGANEPSPSGDDRPPPADAQTADASTSEDLLPTDWRPDIESLRAGDEFDPPETSGPGSDVDGEMDDDAHEPLPPDASAPAPEGFFVGELEEDIVVEVEEDVVVDPEGMTEEPLDVIDLPEETLVETAVAGAWAAEPTAEMTGQEWTRLRDVLGEEEGQEEEVYALDAEAPGVSSEESTVGFGAEGEGDRPDWLEPGGGHELTLEDMKKAPPEYRHLPGPREGGTFAQAGSGAEDRDLHPPGELGADMTRPAESEEPVVAPEEPMIAPEEPMVAPEEPAWPEPSIAEVEAAADQLAEEFRDSEEPSEVEVDLLADLDERSGPRTVRVGAPESLTGPTWEEPTSQPLMAESGAGQPPAPGTGRDVPKAAITAGALAVVALLSLLISKSAFVLVAGIVVLGGQAELYAAMRRRGHQPATALGLVVGAFAMAGAYRRGEPALVFFVVLGLFLSFLWYMAAPLKAREDVIRHVGSTMMGVLYVPVLASYVFLLLAQPASGRALMLTVIGLTFWYDTWAFVVGSFWGSRPLAPTVSPRKSWEGLLGATAITFFSAIAVVPTALDYLSVTKAIGLAIVIVVFAPLGDLIESLIKRDLGVKDMGSVLPGHGGVLDRIDSVLLVAPAAFYFIRLVF